MDEVNIKSKLLQKAIVSVIEKILRQKTGCQPKIRFNDPIHISYDGNKANVHLNLDADRQRL